MQKQVQIVISAVDKASTQLRGIANRFANFGERNKATFESMRNYGAIASGAVVGLGLSFINTAGKFETYNIALKNAIGSQEEATKSMVMLREISAKTPFELENLTQSYIRLVNRGFKPTREQIIQLGDLAASQGKQFDQLTEAVLDAQVGEFERLKEFGIRASVNGDKVAFTFKGVTTEVNKTSGAIVEYLIGLGKLDGVAGATEEQSKTLVGRLSTLRDEFKNMALEVGNKLLPVLTPLIERLTVIITKVGEWVGRNPELTVTILAIVAGLTALVTVIGTLGVAIAGISGLLATFGVAVGALGVPILLIIGAIVAWSIAIAQLVSGRDLMIATFKWQFQSLVDSLIEMFENLKNWFAELWNSIKQIFIDAWEGIKSGVLGIIDGFTSGVKTRLEGILSFAKSTIQTILGLVEGAQKLAGSVGEKVQEGIQGVGNFITGKRALGGTIMAGKPYLVGEDGGEIITPMTTSRVTPVGETKGGLSVNINLGNVNINNAQDENRLVQMIKNAFIEEAKNFSLGISV